MKITPRIKFLLSNGLKGFVWLVVLIVAYILFEELVMAKDPEAWIERFYSNPLLIYLIYIGSEFFIGLFPPELFMLWALNNGGILHYVWNVLFFAGVSFGFGFLNFWVGKFFFHHGIFNRIREKHFSSTWEQLRKYGLFLIIVAALTPVPWAAVCLLVGWADYPQRKFLIYASARLLRFAIYGLIIYQTHHF